MIHRKSKAGARESRIGVGIIPGRNHAALFIEKNPVRELSHVGLAEDGTNQTLVQPGNFKLLVDIIGACFEIQFSDSDVLTSYQARATAIGLLQLETLREAVIESCADRTQTAGETDTSPAQRQRVERGLDRGHRQERQFPVGLIVSRDIVRLRRSSQFTAGTARTKFMAAEKVWSFCVASVRDNPAVAPPFHPLRKLERLNAFW